MTGFLQLHYITAYPPANLNRDDTGRPKTAYVGDVPRLRISSQALKRAWRQSPVLADDLDGHIGTRTQRLGVELHKALTGEGVKDKTAQTVAQAVASYYAKLKSPRDKEKGVPTEHLETGQLIHISPVEEDAAFRVARSMAAAGRTSLNDDDAAQLIHSDHRAADIALFGRMLAEKPRWNVEAAAQVAHAISVNKVVVEDDYFSAVDDWNPPEEDVGAGHIGQFGFGAGIFYGYICLDRSLLVRNLGGDQRLADAATKALVKAAATVGPRGKQASFGSRANASYVMAERGTAQPRSLVEAFLKPVGSGGDPVEEAAERLQNRQAGFVRSYDEDTRRTTLNVLKGTGTLAELAEFAVASAPASA